MTTEIIWHGHAGFSIKGNIEVLVDPFFSGNPIAKEKAGDMNPDIIAVTHGHFDHAGDAVAISRKNGAPILCSFELSEILKKEDAQTIDTNPGGTVEFRVPIINFEYIDFIEYTFSSCVPVPWRMNFWNPSTLYL